ncbi:MAG: rubrerythrin family protein [Actinobacteria bacterium]|nr:rubrerythrin family protein [Actinomycetota bacterium]
MEKTRENLRKAFAGESQARNKYTYFASIARREGYEQIAAIFRETAENEKEHAKIALTFLKELGDTRTNLEAAVDGEHGEWTEMYPEFERTAREEGLDEIADFFQRVATIEQAHEERFKALLANIKEAKVFRRGTPVKWLCRNCGFIYEGTEAPEVCPACLHPKSFYEIKAVNY